MNVTGIVEYEDLARLFNVETADGVVNQHTGGNNNRKGNDFETRFAVYLIAKYASTARASIATQLLEFVDDLQVVHHCEARGCFVKIDYQMKDRQSLSWSELESDFSRQHVLNAEILSIGDSLQSVVVSRSELASKLNQSIPDGIEDHTSVMVFPNVSSNRLLMEKPELREAIKELCAFPDEPDKLESVLKVLAAAWIDQPVNHRIPISSIIETASACSPTFFKVDGKWDIPDEVCSIFDDIEGFAYEIKHGFFTYTYGSSTAGNLPYNCNDQRFEKFLQLVAKLKPLDYDHLEPHLN